MHSVPLALVITVAAAGVARADEPVYRATVEVANTQGANHAIVTSKLSCGTPAKCPEWTLDLGPADAAELITLVDLRGEPTRVRYPATKSADTLPAAAKLPAAFVRVLATDAANTRWERWTIVSLEAGRAKAIWRGEITMTPDKGGGFSTADGIDLVATAKDQPLALEFAQTSLPGPKDKPHHAAKPLHRRFVMKDSTYQRDSSQ